MLPAVFDEQLATVVNWKYWFFSFLFLHWVVLLEKFFQGIHEYYYKIFRNIDFFHDLCETDEPNTFRSTRLNKFAASNKATN